MRLKLSDWISLVALGVSVLAFYCSIRDVDSVIVTAIDYDDISQDDRVVAKIAFSNSGNRPYLISSVDALVSDDGLTDVDNLGADFTKPFQQSFVLEKDKIKLVEVHMPRTKITSSVKKRSPLYFAARILAVDVKGNQINEDFWYASVCVEDGEIIESKLPLGYIKLGAFGKPSFDARAQNPCLE